MRARLPLIASLAASAVMFGSILFLFALVVTSLVLGTEINFPGGPEIADASLGRGGAPHS